MSIFPTSGSKRKSGCWVCSFRNKLCTPNPDAPQGPCNDCHKYNIVCYGQGIARPSGQELREQVRGAIKSWTLNRTNRAPLAEPLDLSSLWTPLEPLDTFPDDFPHRDFFGDLTPAPSLAAPKV
ncbi:hypothetical protein BS47DRAFT_1354617 [Hydnum rufescens UP504]|uniref:Zn(2)-C6 fungal-type domain-containing protein n=1 Tax=Hydnum rufescens UP504 TaxID=1448309 RepID=A0A9P6DN45_9AGAM|nr:hypothetical protein BS47DRAFT_1354617 [Hydnum rufescens UP504]